MEMLHYKLPMTDRAMALRFQMRLNYLGNTALVSRDNTLYIWKQSDSTHYTILYFPPSENDNWS